MTKNFKGGYKIVSLNGNDLASGDSFVVNGLYENLVNSYKKPILVTEIVIDGEKQQDSFAVVKQSDGGYKIDVYDYALTVTSEDSVSAVALPEITSIGTGLTLTDGELSSNVQGGDIYFHRYVIKEKTGTAFRCNLEFFISKDTVFTSVEELINYFLVEGDTNVILSGTGTFGASGGTQNLVGGINYYTSSPTRISIQYWGGTAYSGNNYNFTDVEFQSTKIKKV